MRQAAFRRGGDPPGGGAVSAPTAAPLTEILGYTADEHISVSHQVPGGEFQSKVMPVAGVRPHLQRLPQRPNVWFGVNPVRPMTSGRGTEVDVTRASALTPSARHPSG